MNPVRLNVGIVAGERSGDVLGGALMQAIQSRVPHTTFYGVGGERMLRHGLHAIADIEQLSIHGFVDPLLRVVPLYRLLNQLRRELSRMDVVVGVDFNVFNLILERSLKKRGVPTAHYVSPSVYAWRRGRIKKIGRATNIVMTLFPFETEVYEHAGIRAEFVGHPIADQYDPAKLRDDLRRDAREQLHFALDEFVVAVMPGSRRSELKFHFELFLNSVRLFSDQLEQGNIRVLVPSGHPICEAAWREIKDKFTDLDVHILNRPAVDVLAASDVALVKSGTGTLEAMFMKVPMVIAYRIGALSAKVILAMLKTDHVGLPNILAGAELVPELIQDDATPQNIANALFAQTQQGDPKLQATYTELHRTLKKDASAQAAEAVLSLVNIDASLRSRN